MSEITRSDDQNAFAASHVLETTQNVENRSQGALRDDLAALLVDREEQSRLDGELSIDAARMTSEPETELLVAMLRRQVTDLQLVATKARGLVRTAYVPSPGEEITVVRTWWDSLTKALKVLDDSGRS